MEFYLIIIACYLIFVDRFHDCFQVRKHDSKAHHLKIATEEDYVNVALSRWQYPEKTNRYEAWRRNWDI